MDESPSFDVNILFNLGNFEYDGQLVNLTIVATSTTWLETSTNLYENDTRRKLEKKSPVDEINSFYFYETEQFAVLWILFVLIILGNSGVLVTLIVSKSRKSRMNFFIKQLALADLSVGVINVLTDIVWRITVAWYAGNAACKVIRFTQALVTFGSTYVLVALSIDRYDAITHPMNFSGSWRRARVLIFVAWALSFLFASPMLILFEEKVVQGQIQCWIDLTSSQWRIYMTLISVILFVIPTVIISACYVIIVRTIWSKSNVLLVHPSHTHAHQNHQDMERYIHEENDSGNEYRRASSRGIIPRAKIKTIQMTFVIVFVFVLCWSPYIVFDLLQVYEFIPRTQANIAWATFIQSLAPLNSAANPIIYCLFSTHSCNIISKLPGMKFFCECQCCAPLHCLEGYHFTRSGDITRTVTSSLTHSSGRRIRSNPSSLRQPQQPPLLKAGPETPLLATSVALQPISPKCAISSV